MGKMQLDDFAKNLAELLTFKQEDASWYKDSCFLFGDRMQPIQRQNINMQNSPNWLKNSKKDYYYSEGKYTLHYTLSSIAQNLKSNEAETQNLSACTAAMYLRVYIRQLREGEYPHADKLNALEAWEYLFDQLLKDKFFSQMVLENLEWAYKAGSFKKMHGMYVIMRGFITGKPKYRRLQDIIELPNQDLIQLNIPDIKSNIDNPMEYMRAFIEKTQYKGDAIQIVNCLACLSAAPEILSEEIIINQTSTSIFLSLLKNWQERYLENGDESSKDYANIVLNIVDNYLEYVQYDSLDSDHTMLYYAINNVKLAHDKCINNAGTDAQKSKNLNSLKLAICIAQKIATFLSRRSLLTDSINREIFNLLKPEGNDASVAKLQGNEEAYTELSQFRKNLLDKAQIKNPVVYARVLEQIVTGKFIPYLKDKVASLKMLDADQVYVSHLTGELFPVSQITEMYKSALIKRLAESGYLFPNANGDFTSGLKIMLFDIASKTSDPPNEYNALKLMIQNWLAYCEESNIEILKNTKYPALLLEDETVVQHTIYDFAIDEQLNDFIKNISADAASNELSNSIKNIQIPSEEEIYSTFKYPRNKCIVLEEIKAYRTIMATGCLYDDNKIDQFLQEEFAKKDNEQNSLMDDKFILNLLPQLLDDPEQHSINYLLKIVQAKPGLLVKTISIFDGNETITTNLLDATIYKIRRVAYSTKEIKTYSTLLLNLLEILKKSKSRASIFGKILKSKNSVGSNILHELHWTVLEVINKNQTQEISRILLGLAKEVREQLLENVGEEDIRKLTKSENRNKETPFYNRENFSQPIAKQAAFEIGRIYGKTEADLKINDSLVKAREQKIISQAIQCNMQQAEEQQLKPITIIQLLGKEELGPKEEQQLKEIDFKSASNFINSLMQELYDGRYSYFEALNRLFKHAPDMVLHKFTINSFTNNKQTQKRITIVEMIIDCIDDATHQAMHDLCTLTDTLFENAEFLQLIKTDLRNGQNLFHKCCGYKVLQFEDGKLFDNFLKLASNNGILKKLLSSEDLTYKENPIKLLIRGYYLSQLKLEFFIRKMSSIHAACIENNCEEIFRKTIVEYIAELYDRPSPLEVFKAKNSLPEIVSLLTLNYAILPEEYNFTSKQFQKHPNILITNPSKKLYAACLNYYLIHGKIGNLSFSKLIQQLQKGAKALSDCNEDKQRILEAIKELKASKTQTQRIKNAINVLDGKQRIEQQQGIKDKVDKIRQLKIEVCEKIDELTKWINGMNMLTTDKENEAIINTLNTFKNLDFHYIFDKEKLQISFDEIETYLSGLKVIDSMNNSKFAANQCKNTYNAIYDLIKNHINQIILLKQKCIDSILINGQSSENIDEEQELKLSDEVNNSLEKICRALTYYTRKCDKKSIIGLAKHLRKLANNNQFANVSGIIRQLTYTMQAACNENMINSNLILFVTDQINYIHNQSRAEIAQRRLAYSSGYENVSFWQNIRDKYYGLTKQTQKLSMKRQIKLLDEKKEELKRIQDPEADEQKQNLVQNQIQEQQVNSSRELNAGRYRQQQNFRQLRYQQQGRQQCLNQQLNEQQFVIQEQKEILDSSVEKNSNAINPNASYEFIGIDGNQISDKYDEIIRKILTANSHTNNKEKELYMQKLEEIIEIYYDQLVPKYTEYVPQTNPHILPPMLKLGDLLISKVGLIGPLAKKQEELAEKQKKLKLALQQKDENEAQDPKFGK